LAELKLVTLDMAEAIHILCKGHCSIRGAIFNMVTTFSAELLYPCLFRYVLGFFYSFISENLKVEYNKHISKV